MTILDELQPGDPVFAITDGDRLHPQRTVYGCFVERRSARAVIEVAGAFGVRRRIQVHGLFVGRWVAWN